MRQTNLLSRAAAVGFGASALYASMRSWERQRALQNSGSSDCIAKPPLEQKLRVGMIDAKSALKCPKPMLPEDARAARANLRSGAVTYTYPQRTRLSVLPDFLGRNGGVAEGDWAYYLENPHQVACAFIRNEARDYGYPNDTHDYPRRHHPDHPGHGSVYAWHDTCVEEDWTYNDETESKAEVMVGPPPTGPRILRRLADRIRESEEGTDAPGTKQ